MARNIMRVCFLIGLCSIFAGSPLYAETDPVNSDLVNGYGLRNLPNAVIITANPAIPSAGDTVHFTVEGSVYDLPKDTITWTVNGKTVASGVGEQSVDVKVDAKGSTLNVSVSVSDAVWGIATDALTIVPFQIDILYDAPTYVPPFYRGRALPSAGGTMRLQAVARLTKGSSLVPNSSLIYTWSRNGTVLGNLSGVGKYKVTMDAPHMYGSDSITVRANTADETLSASATIVIPDTLPALMLYEDHPLYGVAYFDALSGVIPAPNDITVAAIPYFATITGLNDPTLRYSWLLNDVPVTASSTRRNEITIEAREAAAALHLDLSSSRNFFFGTSSDWQFQFGSSGGSTINKKTGNDAFHNADL